MPLSAFPPSPGCFITICLQACRGLLKPRIIIITVIRSISGGRDRGHHVAACVRLPWPSWLGAGGAWGQRARRGRQPALRLSAPLTLAVRLRNMEGLIALIDTFPSRPTLGRPRLLRALVSFLCSGRKRGEVRPWQSWRRGWGRGREGAVRGVSRGEMPIR